MPCALAANRGAGKWPPAYSRRLRLVLGFEQEELGFSKHGPSSAHEGVGVFGADAELAADFRGPDQGVHSELVPDPGADGWPALVVERFLLLAVPLFAAVAVVAGWGQVLQIVGPALAGWLDVIDLEGHAGCSASAIPTSKLVALQHEPAYPWRDALANHSSSLPLPAGRTQQVSLL